ncbi:MAG: GNAT family N-acetyltransferase [Chloroflexota bacterium]
MHPSTTYQLRPITPEDEAFLYRVYASTRQAEMALVPWDDAQKAAFVRQQFEAQRSHYAHYYSGAAFDVIEVNGLPAGRLYLSRGKAEYRIVDITLLPEFRGRGIGSAILADIQAEAAQAGASVAIHVERFNPALKWYERLGFRVLEDKGVYLFMEWRPA